MSQATAQHSLSDPVACDEVCCGMDVPSDPWTAEDVAFWSGSPTYQPWKDVAAYFRGTEP